MGGWLFVYVFADLLSCLSWKWRKRSSVKITERTHEEATEALHAFHQNAASEWQPSLHSAWDAAVARRCTSSGGGLRRALQQRAFEQRHRLHHAKGHARRASAGDSGRAGSEVGRGEGTAEESPPAGRVTDETDCFRLADKPSNRPWKLGWGLK